MSEQGWAAEVAQTVAANVRRLRRNKGMQQQDLCDEMTKLGAPMKRNVLANFESGRRPLVSVAELLAFARCLDVPPLALILPLADAPDFEVLQGVSVPVDQAEAWISGTAYDERELGPLHLPTAWIAQQSGLDRLRRHRTQVIAARSAVLELEHAKAAGEANEALVPLMQKADSTRTLLGTTRRYMSAMGEVPPRLPQELSEIDSQHDSISAPWRD